MAFVGSGDTLRKSYIAGATARTTTSQYGVAYLSAADTASIINTNTSHPIGIIDSYQSSGSGAVSVIVHGPAKAYAGASIAAGSLVMPQTATALVITATATLTAYILGRAESAASTIGAITIYVNPMGI